MQSPQISIIVPIYNAERTLCQCVDSILAQEYQDFELILVDDGSKDGSFEICERYSKADKRIRFFHKENGGVSSARNLGIEQVRGNWVTFVDSDDMISADYLNGVEGSVEDLLMVGYLNISQDCKSRGSSNHVPKREEVVKDISLFLNQRLNIFEMRGPYCKFYQVKLISDMRFHTDMYVAEDACFVMEYMQKVHSMRILPNSYYLFRNHGSESRAELRYQTDIGTATVSLSHLREAIDNLVSIHSVNRNLLYPYIVFFKTTSKRFWQHEPSLWYGDKRIREMYKYVWSSVSFLNKMRIIISLVFWK